MDNTSGAGERFNVRTHPVGILLRLSGLGGGERLHRRRITRRPNNQRQLGDRRAGTFWSLRVGERPSCGVNRIGHTAEDSPPAGEWTGAVEAGMSVPTATIETMTPTRLDLDDVVAVATIVEAMLERPMTPNESSRFKSAYQRGGTLAGFADQIAA